MSFAEPEEGAFTLNPPIKGAVKQASIKGYQMVLRSAMAFDALFAADSAGERAFEDATKYIFQAMMESMSKKLEIRLFHGQMGLSQVASTSGNVISITASEWAPGIWAGAENMKLEIYSSSNVLRGDCSVVSVSFEDKTVTVDSLPAGVVATDIIFEYGSFGKEMAGLHKIVTNTGSIFGISSSQYALWKGNSHPVAGALTFSKLAQGLSKPVEKGLESDVVIFVNPRSWASLMTEQAGARRFDVSYKEAKGNNGFEALEFYSQNGKMQIMSSNYVKEGYAYAINPENFLRVGSTDITFKSPMVKDEFIHLLPDNNGYGIRAYTNQALFCNKIGHQLLFTGIA